MNGGSAAGNNAVPIWVFAALVLAGGYFLAVKPVWSDADATNERIAAARERYRADERSLADRARVAAQARAIRTELRGTLLASSYGASTASFLADVQALARRDGVVLEAMRPDGAPAAASASPDPSAAHLDGFVLETHGPFARVARFVVGLSRMPTLVRVVGVRIARIDARDASFARDRTLDANVTIQTVRFNRSSFP